VTSTYLALPQSSRSTGTAQRGLFSADEYASVARFFDGHTSLRPTPLTSLPHLARTLGLGAVLAKDETARFGLNAFKLLGARFAIEQLIGEGAVRPGDTLVCASEGNHGRAVAHTARAVGCAARVYLSESVAQARADAIAGEGAVVVRVPGTYDDAVRVAAAEAAEHGWTVISDTSWPEYERIPRLIMLGYSWMVDEMVSAMPPGWRPDVIFVPGGVGGLLATLEDPAARPLRDALALDASSTVVVIVSEGMTDPALWHRVVGP
jgi:diaminopropionate ammonia-lyase